MISSWKDRWWVWVAVGLTFAKLWLTQGQAIFAIGTAGHDDQLFVKLAESLVSGNWLGPYDQLTLAKGPFYSIWIALVFLIGLPLGFAQQLAYAGACAVVVRALTPLVKTGAGRLTAYAFLLWNPMSFEASSLGRVLRQHVSTPLALLIFAGLIALYTRRAEPLRRLAPWAATLGGAVGAFWLSREDAAWIVPSIVLLGAAIVAGVVRSPAGTWRTQLRAGLLAVLCGAVPVILVCWQNARHYEWFGTVELRASEFKDAYGALLRVRVGPELPYVPVTRQAREAIYAISPTFAQLRPHLDGPIGEGWAGASSYVTHLPAEERQIGGGWFMWALRDSVAAIGYCHNAGDALAFYRRVAMEVNQACDDGRLPAGHRRSGFLPPWRQGLTREWLAATSGFVDYFVSFRSFSAYPPASIGGRDELLLFSDLTRDRLAPSPALEPTTPRQAALDAWKLFALQAIGKVLRQLIFWLVLAAQVVALVRAAQLAWQRRLTYLFVLAAAAWGACAATILIDALIHVTSFPALAVAYLDSAYPLLLLFVIAVILDATVEWWPLIHRRRTPLPVGGTAVGN
jgi:hypothetical protein